MDKRPEEKHQLAANLVRKEDTPMPVPPQQFDIFEDDDEFEEFEEEGWERTVDDQKVLKMWKDDWDDDDISDDFSKALRAELEKSLPAQPK